MKTSKTLFLILISAVFAIGCKKEQINNPIAQNGLSTRTLSSTQMAVFTNGYVSASSFRIINLDEVLYDSDELQTFPLLSRVLDGRFEHLSEGVYGNLIIRATAQPGNGESAFYLTGTVRTAKGDIPMIFMVNQPVTLRIPERSVTINESTTMADLMNISMQMLTERISDDMWNSAAIEDNIMVIAVDRNPELFKAILNNLSIMTNLQFI
jgi:hypothetical protein